MVVSVVFCLRAVKCVCSGLMLNVLVRSVEVLTGLEKCEVSGLFFKKIEA